MRIIIKIIFDIFLILISIIIVFLFLLWKDTFNPYNNDISLENIPTFTSKKINDNHNFNTNTSLPVRASALIDINNDNVDEIFLWWASGQDDKIFWYKNNKFIDISSKYNIKKWDNLNSLAASSIDLDNNGFSDLIVSREDWVYIYYNNNWIFTLYKPKLQLTNKSTPLSLTFWDINKDGFADIFLSTYIKKEKMNGQTNFSSWYGSKSVMLLNNQDNTFKDITDEAGLNFVHNTFQWILIDINNDTWLDLVVAYDTWEPRIYKNNWNSTFTLVKNPYTWKFSYPMWIAVWDYNNDWLVDLFFSNIGSTLPKVMVKWNLKDTNNLYTKWILLENKWNFVFKDVAEKVNVSDFEFSWGSVFADMNNDWLQDLIVAENYVDLWFQKLFKSPWRLLIQKKDHSFVATEKRSGVVNTRFWITPLVSDFNLDWYLDLVWVNISESSSVFINNGWNNNYLKVKLPDTSKSIWAKLTLTTDTWLEITEDYIIWEWLAGDQTNIINFGIWKAKKIKKLKIKYINWSEKVFLYPQINTLLKIK